ncbi:unnamed protein product [Notodromas monacha]|uniref:Transducer of regulated CREB activity C-terminal domain-containing protein n=1 Tax=Notodromas monacha TaxID=399045 RepID=A0A7R9BJH1_9CRUS|nr:unnamed protein product [Notodromas monacha]CAG0915782.1 unnamed protein product [Notodromas monacha]
MYKPIERDENAALDHSSSLRTQGGSWNSTRIFHLIIIFVSCASTSIAILFAIFYNGSSKSFPSKTSNNVQSNASDSDVYLEGKDSSARMMDSVDEALMAPTHMNNTLAVEDKSLFVVMLGVGTGFVILFGVFFSLALYRKHQKQMRVIHLESKPYPRYQTPSYARSLPNVNQINGPRDDTQIPFGCFDQAYGGVDVRPDVGGPCRPREKKNSGVSPASSRHSLMRAAGPGGSGTLNWPYSRNSESAAASSAGIPLSNIVSGSSIMSTSAEKAPSFLSPPPQFGDFWRRTNSDSALHQSVVGPDNSHPVFIAHCAMNAFVDDGMNRSPLQDNTNSSPTSVSPSLPSPPCQQNPPGYEVSPGSISITCHPLSLDADADVKPTIHQLRRESPRLVLSVGCGADDPMKLAPDSSTSPSGSLPDLNVMHIPPLSMGSETAVYRVASRSDVASRKFSQPTAGIDGSFEDQGVDCSLFGMGNTFEPDGTLSNHAKFFKYRGLADTTVDQPTDRKLILLGVPRLSSKDDWGADSFPGWVQRSETTSSPIPIPGSAAGCNQIPLVSSSVARQGSNSPGSCGNAQSAPASPSEASPQPCSQALFVSELMGPLQNVCVDAFAKPATSPEQTQNVLRRLQLINMIVTNTNGSVEVSIADGFSPFLRHNIDVTNNAQHHQPSSNHGIVITLTAPSDSLEPLNVSPTIPSHVTGLEDEADLPQDLSDIFGLDYGSEDAICADLVPLDVDGLQLLMNPENNLTDAATEDHFRWDRH